MATSTAGLDILAGNHVTDQLYVAPKPPSRLLPNKPSFHRSNVLPLHLAVIDVWKHGLKGCCTSCMPPGFRADGYRWGTEAVSGDVGVEVSL